MMRTRRMVGAVSLMGVTLVGAPVPATAADGTAQLYELTENLKLFRRGKPNVPATNRRIATSALAGTALPGTPLCPEPEVQSSSLGCTVNVQGQDDISLVTGLGTFRGDFATVVAGDNPFDGPELVVLRGEFRGDMDFEPAIVRQIPYGTVVGWVRARGGRRTDFTGVFRLPFDGNATTEVEVAPGTTVTLTLRQLFCPATPDPNRNFEDIDKFNGIDLAYLDNVDAAATPAGRCVNIKLDELSLGVPLVRFNIDF